MNRRLSQSSFMLTVCAVVLVCIVGAVSLPHSGYIRYQSFSGTIFSKLTWIYERIHNDDRPIDVVFLGSSREGAGANSPQIEDELKSLGLPLNVVNFSIPAAGYDVRLTKLRELLSRRKIKLLVFGVVEALPRDGHQAFGNLGTVQEILTAPPLINRNLPGNLARLPYRQMELSVATLLPEAFGYRRDFDPTLYAGSNLDNRLHEPEQDPDVVKSNATELSHQETLEQESTMRKRQIKRPILPASLSFIEFGVSQHYVTELLSLSKQHDFEVVFLFLPFYKGYSEPADLAYLEQFGPVWRPTFIMNDSDNYRDAAHVTQKAADQLSVWLAERISTHIKTRNDNPSRSAEHASCGDRPTGHGLSRSVYDTDGICRRLPGIRGHVPMLVHLSEGTGSRTCD